MQPIFRNVFKKATHVNPFIYLKGVSHKDLVALLDYIYTGQAKVLAEDVDRFIQVGKDLQVKGLADAEKEVVCNTKNMNVKNANVDRKTEELSDESYDSTNVDDSIDSFSNDMPLAENLKTTLDIKKEKDNKNVKNLDQLKAELSEKMEKIKDEEGMTTWKC